MRAAAAVGCGARRRPAARTLLHRPGPCFRPGAPPIQGRGGPSRCGGKAEAEWTDGKTLRHLRHPRAAVRRALLDRSRQPIAREAPGAGWQRLNGHFERKVLYWAHFTKCPRITGHNFLRPVAPATE